MDQWIHITEVLHLAGSVAVLLHAEHWAHSRCFKALDSSLILLGPFQLKVSYEFL